MFLSNYAALTKRGRDVAQVVEHSPVKVGILRSSLNGGAFAIWAIFHSNKWSTTSPSKTGMCCPVWESAYDSYTTNLLIGKRSLCGDSGFPLKKYVTMTICLTSNSWWYENQCTLEASLNKKQTFLYVRIQQTDPPHRACMMERTVWTQGCGLYVGMECLWTRVYAEMDCVNPLAACQAICFSRACNCIYIYITSGPI